ncbi:MAG: TolC family protein [Saprospiraceae bacterium]
MNVFRENLWILLFCSVLHAQEQWSLASCIDHAIKNNVSLQQTKLTVDLAAINVVESKHKRLPDLGGSLGGGINFGRGIDPTTNSFTTENIVYTNYSLSSGVVLFQAGFVRNSIKQTKLDYQASEKELQQAQNDLGLAIATYYLNVLLSQERLDIASKTVESVKLQLVQIQKLIQNGMKPEADAIEIKSQLARAEQSFVVAENSLNLAWLSLKQAMRLDPAGIISLEKLTQEQLNSIQLNSYTYETLYENASKTLPGLIASKIRLKSAIVGEKLARAIYFPSIYLSGSIGSRFSNAAIRPAEYALSKVLVPGVFIDGNPAKFDQEYLLVKSTEVVPFATQFDQFLGYGAGLTINIPIYKNYATKANVQRAKLTTKQNELRVQIEEENLNQNIYQAIANVSAARKEFEASQKAYDASKSSYEKTQKRFDIGAANTFELNQTQTNMQNAETALIISKYDLVFKQKVLDYYAGKQIRL